MVSKENYLFNFSLGRVYPADAGANLYWRMLGGRRCVTAFLQPERHYPVANSFARHALQRPSLRIVWDSQCGRQSSKGSLAVGG